MITLTQFETMKLTYNAFLICLLPILFGKGLAQIDTTIFDLNESYLKKRKCNKLLLDTWHFSISYSPSQFSQQDSAVFYNSDTILLKVYNKDRLLYSSLKLPEGDLVGWLSYYSASGKLKKKEFRTRQLCATDGKWTHCRGGDGMIKTILISYKTGIPVKKKEQKLEYDPNLGFYESFSKYKYLDGSFKLIKRRRHTLHSVNRRHSE